jgi:uncharacterized protein YjiS (DUF1127 family)
MSTRVATITVAGTHWSAMAAAQQSAADWLSRGTARLLRLARHGRRRRRTERSLLALSDATLKDIGLRRAEIGFVADVLATGGTVRRGHRD